MYIEDHLFTGRSKISSSFVSVHIHELSHHEILIQSFGHSENHGLWFLYFLSIIVDSIFNFNLFADDSTLMCSFTDSDELLFKTNLKFSFSTLSDCFFFVYTRTVSRLQGLVTGRNHENKNVNNTTYPNCSYTP